MALAPGQGVLMVGHGTVGDVSELPEFLTKIRHGRPYPQELLDELRHRYQTIGRSPLLSITQGQAARLSDRLGAPAFVAMRFAGPDLPSALEQARAAGITRLIVLPVAPFSVHVYAQVAEDALERCKPAWGPTDLELVPVESWGSEPRLILAHCDRIRAVLDKLAAPTHLILTAHSLPLSVVRRGDPYPIEVSACADAVANGLGRPCELAYQSQGADGGEWLGPDLQQVLRLAAARGHRSVTVAPVGFLADHVETLYDLDVEAAGFARELGLEFHRAQALNVHPDLIGAMANVVERALARRTDAD